MPNREGWHLRSEAGMRWHFCRLQDRDTLVRDTPESRREHERACRKETARLDKLARQEAKRRSLEGLAAHRAEKKLVAS